MYGTYKYGTVHIRTERVAWIIRIIFWFLFLPATRARSLSETLTETKWQNCHSGSESRPFSSTFSHSWPHIYLSIYLFIFEKSPLSKQLPKTQVVRLTGGNFFPPIASQIYELSDGGRFSSPNRLIQWIISPIKKPSLQTFPTTFK